uniref:Uncharacterized protein n=1 Tax=viral metagenome TaxID=1070528 RepID=A0A6C0I6G3_9ZZZZ
MHIFLFCFVPYLLLEHHSYRGRLHCGHCDIPDKFAEENSDLIVSHFEKKRLLDYLTNENIGIVDKVNVLTANYPAVYLGSVLNGGLLDDWSSDNNSNSSNGSSNGTRSNSSKILYL